MQVIFKIAFWGLLLFSYTLGAQEYIRNADFEKLNYYLHDSLTYPELWDTSEMFVDDWYYYCNNTFYCFGSTTYEDLLQLHIGLGLETSDLYPYLRENDIEEGIGLLPIQSTTDYGYNYGCGLGPENPRLQRFYESSLFKKLLPTSYYIEWDAFPLRYNSPRSTYAPPMAISFTDVPIFTEQERFQYNVDGSEYDVDVIAYGTVKYEWSEFTEPTYSSICFEALGTEAYIQVGSMGDLYGDYDGWYAIDNLKLINLDSLKLINDTTICVEQRIDLNEYNLKGLNIYVDDELLIGDFDKSIGEYDVRYELDDCGILSTGTIVVSDSCTVCHQRVYDYLDTILCPFEIIELASEYDDISFYMDGQQITSFSQDTGTYLIDYFLDNCGVIGHGYIRVLSCTSCFDWHDSIHVCLDDFLSPIDYFSRNLIYAKDGIDVTNEANWQSGSFEMTVYSQDCSDLSSIHIQLNKCIDCSVYVPTAFSPNNDGVNDLLQPYFECGQGKSLTIYDRWGNVIYMDSIEPYCWDGSANGNQVESGVYIYKLEYTEDNDVFHVKTGDVTLIK